MTRFLGIVFGAVGERILFPLTYKHHERLVSLRRGGIRGIDELGVHSIVPQPLLGTGN